MRRLRQVPQRAAVTIIRGTAFRAINARMWQMSGFHNRDAVQLP
jgi:hypothetical protein